MMKRLSGLLSKNADSHFSELIRGSGLALFLKIAGIAVTYAFTYIITRSFGASVNGLFNLAFAVLTLATVIARAGLDTAMLKFTAAYHAEDRPEAVKGAYLDATGIVFSIGLVVTLIMYWLSDTLAASLFHKPGLADYLRLFALLVIPYSMIMVNSECLRGIRRIKWYLFLEGIGVNLFGSVFLLAMLAGGGTASSLARSFGLAVAVLFVISTVAWLRASGWRGLRVARPVGIRELLFTSLPMLLANVLMKVMGWIDTIMLGMLRPAEDVGIYNIALKISMLTKLTLNAVNSVIAPRFAAYYRKGDMASFIRTSDHATRLIFWTSAPVLVLILLIPGPLTGLFGPEFTAGATALVILTVGQFIASISGSVGYILNMTGHQVIQQNITIVSIVLNVMLNFVLIPRIGMTGAAIAASAGLAFRNLASVVYIRKKLHFTTVFIPFLRNRPPTDDPS